MKSFAQLFAGRTDCYGFYRVEGERSDGKQKGRGYTKKEALPEDGYDRHLQGKWMLGIVPIQLDGTVSWFAADIDVYGIDLKELELKCQKEEIPFVICRTKSGGAHAYCFIDGTIPASDARALCKQWLEKLGHPKAEIFPKQDQVSEESVGNWINLPYYNAHDTDRYAIGLNGERLTLRQFEQLAMARTVRPQDLAPLLKRPGQKKQRSEWQDAPPCIEKMEADGIEALRNNSLTQWAVYFYKSDPDNWRDRVYETNYRVCRPPLPQTEVNDIIKNISSGKYQYLCTIEPMCSICDKAECRTRKWGVGPQQGLDYAQIVVDRLVKINSDPPIYIPSVNGVDIKLTTEEWLDVKKFRKRVYETVGILVPVTKQSKHEAMILEAQRNLVVEEAPDEVSLDGQVNEAFHDWAGTHCPRSQKPMDVLRGFPWYDDKRDAIVFRGQDLIGIIKKRRSNVADRDVWAALRSIGAIRENHRIEGRQCKVWVYPVDGKAWFTIPGKEEF